MLVTRNLPLGRDILRCRAHVIAVEGIEQTIFQHRVDEFHITHLCTGAHKGGMMGGRHAFLSARHDNAGITIGDLLQAECDGAQARAAELVQLPGGLFLRNARLHGGLTGSVLSLTSGQDLAHNHFVDVAGGDIGPLQRALDGGSTQIMGGNRCKGPAK